MKSIDAEKLRTRDEEALRELFEALYPKLRLLTRHLTARSVPGSLDADDLANETLFRIYKNLDSLLEKFGPDPIDPDALTRYAYSIARNLLVDSYRREAARKIETPKFSSLSVDEPEETLQEIADQTNIEAQLISAENLDRLAKLLDSVPPHLNEVERAVLMSMIEGKDLNTIASEIERTPSAVYMIKSRLLKRLKSLLTVSEPPAAVTGPRDHDDR
jgi:RNA polymerase sigma factor (sigma-70 family)